MNGQCGAGAGVLSRSKLCLPRSAQRSPDRAVTRAMMQTHGRQRGARHAGHAHAPGGECWKRLCCKCGVGSSVGTVTSSTTIRDRSKSGLSCFRRESTIGAAMRRAEHAIRPIQRPEHIETSSNTFSNSHAGRLGWARRRRRSACPADLTEASCAMQGEHESR